MKLIMSININIIYIIINNEIYLVIILCSIIFYLHITHHLYKSNKILENHPRINWEICNLRHLYYLNIKMII